MKDRPLLIGTLLCCLLIICIWHPSIWAQEEEHTVPQLKLFSNQARPAAEFDHSLHEDTLGDTGCSRYHHVMDTKTNQLIWEEGEETACTECHISKPDKGLTPLMEASHASCTGCHRTLKKAKKTAGPTTCGECHQK